VSDALIELRANLTDVNKLISLCGLPRRGRPPAASPVQIEAISRSCVVLLAAFWENYVECVIGEAVRFLDAYPTAYNRPPGIAKRLRNLNTPNCTQVDALFQFALGLHTAVGGLSWQKMGNPGDRLDKLLKRRHEIAHTGRAVDRQWRSAAARDRAFVESLASHLDEEIALHVQGLCGTRPW
jgi:hypothetical protein